MEGVFETHSLVHNRRQIVKIVLSQEKDGAFAVVDVDTLWRDEAGRDFPWKGRACKIYTKAGRMEIHRAHRTPQLRRK